MVALIVLNLPAAFCLGFGWWVTVQKRSEEQGQEWRYHLCLYALIAATLGLALNLAFLAHGYTGGRSFLGPPEGIWLIVGRTNGVIWIFSLLGAIIGKGKIRSVLFLYLLTSIGANYLFMASTMD